MTQFDRVIPPGKEGKVSASVKTEHLRGNQQKTVTVTTNDPKMPTARLELKGEIIPIIDVQPDYVNFGSAKYGTEQVKEVVIKGEPERALVIKNLLADPAYVQAKLEQDKVAPGQYKLNVVLTDKAPVGAIRDAKVTFETNYPEKPLITIRVTGRIDGPIQVSPISVFFANPDKERPETQARTITVQTVEATPFKILKAETTVPADVKAEVTPVEAGRKYEIKLQYVGDFEKPMFNGKLVIDTDNKVQPQIEVQLSGRIAKGRPPGAPGMPMVPGQMAPGQMAPVQPQVIQAPPTTAAPAVTPDKAKGKEKAEGK